MAASATAQQYLAKRNHGCLPTGRVRVLVSGASPIGAEVMYFLRICFSAIVIEGYGLTESSSCCSCTLPEEVEAGHVGGPTTCVEIKLVDLPDMKYTAADKPYPRGEVRMQGALWKHVRSI